MSNFNGSVYVSFATYVNCPQSCITAATTISLDKEAHSFSLFLMPFFSLSVQSSKNLPLCITKSSTIEIKVKVSTYPDSLCKGLSAHLN